jgi:hypothetical protein
MALSAGYIMSEDEHYRFFDTICRESGWDMWDVEAAGAECLFHLRGVLPRPGIVWVEGRLGFEWPNDLAPLPRDEDLFADSGLYVPGRCCEIVSVHAALGGFDRQRFLLYLDLEVSAVSEEGDFRATFDLGLVCRCEDEFREPDFE